MANADSKARKSSTPGSIIKPGTLCYLTKVTTIGKSKASVSDINGRVVEVVGGPREEWGDGPGPFYDIRAPWITDRFPDRDLICQREQLIPISPGFGEIKRAAIGARRSAAAKRAWERRYAEGRACRAKPAAKEAA